ncbi:MAG: hypothetical protein DRH17_05570 [Deltaproteobacteria bacterium]|nr:MAG: hypothetical protein DRH17_05570 [Deltaproteobacteria bacterium]
MGEIRSTLDIIMERTKHLTMTEEEKEELCKKELAAKVKGLVQKFLDGLTDVQDIKSVIEAKGQESASQIRELLGKELMGRLEPDGHNERIFQLLEEVLSVNADPFKQVIAEFQKKVASEKAIRLDILRRQLAKRRISGSAVIPNLTLDGNWDPFYEKSIKDSKQQLSIIADNQTIGFQSFGS